MSFNITQKDYQDRPAIVPYGAKKVKTGLAELQKQGTDKKGNPWSRIKLPCTYTDDAGNEYTRYAMLSIPYDFGTQGTPLKTLAAILGKSGSELLAAGINDKTFADLDVYAIFGHQTDYQTGELKTYEDKKGITRISYGIVSFAPLSEPDPVSEAFMMNEKAVYDNFTKNQTSTSTDTHVSMDEIPF